MPSFVNHVHACKKLFDKLNVFKKNKYELELALLGSIIVDLDEFGLVKSSIHGKSRLFLDHLLKTDGTYVPLAIGMILHEELDNVIDREFVHPNEQKAKQLVLQHAGSFANYSMIGHYLLDQSTDFHLIKNNPEVLEVFDKIKTTLKDSHAKKIAYHLSVFFGGNYDDILKALLTFKDFDISKFKTIEGMSDVWRNHMFLKMQKQEISSRQKLGFIDRFASNVKLGLDYGSFRLNHKKENIVKLFLESLQKFKQNAVLIKKADKFLERSYKILLNERSELTKFFPKILNKDKSKINV